MTTGRRIFPSPSLPPLLFFRHRSLSLRRLFVSPHPLRILNPTWRSLNQNALARQNTHALQASSFKILGTIYRTLYLRLSIFLRTNKDRESSGHMTLLWVAFCSRHTLYVQQLLPALMYISLDGSAVPSHTSHCTGRGTQWMSRSSVLIISPVYTSNLLRR